MAAMNTVSELKPFKSMWRIKVKIIRLWRQYSAAGGLTIEMILIDANGDKIHASVKKELVNQFDPFLIEGGSKIFINFSLNHSCGSYRSTNHLYKISFLSTTRVRNCEDLPAALTGFDPVNYRDLLAGNLSPDFLVDIIGQIVEVTPLEIVSVNGKDTNKITVELHNTENDRLPLVLWGKFASDVADVTQVRGERSVICVLRFGKIKIWKEERSISNAYNVSDVALNPNMPEVEAFVALLPKDELALAIVDPKPLAMVNGVSDKDDFFVHTPRKSISEMYESRQVEKCIVLCTIAAIDSDMGWYYLSCKVCAKKVQHVPNDSIDDEDDESLLGFTYYCEKCKQYNPKLLPRYKLHLVVFDNTGKAKFLLFDSLAVQLLHQPCIELAGLNSDEIQQPEDLPLALNNLVGKTYLFKVSIERENFVYKHDTYKVLKIISDADMIYEYGQNHQVGVPENSILSDAPEGSMMLSGGSSENLETAELTPVKRKGNAVINVEETIDQNYVTQTPCNIRIKKEKIHKSG